MLSRDPLLDQARAFAALAGAAARFFAEPSQALAGVVREHLGSCRAKGGAARSGTARDSGKNAGEDETAVSRHLSEAAFQTAKAVEECQLFNVRAGRPLTACSEPLWDAAKSLGDSVKTLRKGGGELCVESLVAAKRNAQQAARAADAGVAEALLIPNTVDSIKFRETFSRLSKAADEVHQAADRLGEMAAITHG